MPNRPVYYKYRSLDNFKFFMDILVNNRLYAAKYCELNDIREGIYSHDGTLNKTLIRDIKDIKDDIRICSLSKTSKNQPMWAHYASNHTGVVVKIKVIDEYVQIKSVDYGTIKTGISKDAISNNYSTATDILVCKEKVWKYEEEIRVFKTVTDIDPMAYVKIEIVEIILGKRISDYERDFLKNIISRMGIDIPILEYDEAMKKKTNKRNKL